MTTPTTPPVPAGWYPDPAGGTRTRWWDGTQWTDHFQEPYNPASAAAALRAPEGTKAYNTWIWLVVFLPYVTLPLLFTIDFGSIFRALDPSDPDAVVRAQFAMFLSPGYIALTLGGWVLVALTIFCAYRDWRALQAAGVPQPLHWAWAFFGVAGYPVYPIARSVVVKRRTGHGSAVMWAAIGMIVFTFVVVGIWTGILVSQMLQYVSTIPTS